jgi:hypothetical protein
MREKVRPAAQRRPRTKRIKFSGLDFPKHVAAKPYAVDGKPADGERR